MDARVKDVTRPHKRGIRVKTVTSDVANKRHENADKAQSFFAGDSIHRQYLTTSNAAMNNQEN